MKAIFSFVISFFILWSCTSQKRDHSQSWQQADGKLKILSTTAMIDDLVKQIGGGHVSTLTLIKGELDPHSYQLVKGDDEKLARADLIFCSGLGLEHGPSLREYLAKSTKAFCLGNYLQKHYPKEIIYIQNTPDPHIWMDISLWAKAIPYIIAQLSDKDPSHAKEYQLNGQKLLEKMNQEHLELRQWLQKVPPEKRFLVTSHDAFNYFTKAYLATDEEKESGKWQKRFGAPEGLAPESQLSATDIRLIIEHIKAYNIHVIFPESNISQASLRKLSEVAKEEGLPLKIATKPLYGDAMGASGSSGDSYLKMMRHNIQTIESYLNGGADDVTQP